MFVRERGKGWEGEGGRSADGENPYSELAGRAFLGSYRHYALLRIFLGLIREAQKDDEQLCDVAILGRSTCSA